MTSEWKFSHELQILYALFNRVWIRPNLYLSGAAQSKLRQSPELVDFVKTLREKNVGFVSIKTSRKGTNLSSTKLS